MYFIYIGSIETIAKTTKRHSMWSQTSQNHQVYSHLAYLQYY